MSTLYKLSQYKEVKYLNHNIKLSTFTLAETGEYSLILYIYDKSLDSYYLRQFNNEAKCVEFLESKIGKKL